MYLSLFSSPRPTFTIHNLSLTSLISSQLEQDLTAKLLALNFHALLRTIAQLLTRMGYEDVSLGSRTGFIGRHRAGGVDLTGYRSVDGGRRCVVVQVKQFAPEQKIYRRAIDELRGVGLASAAAEVILITTSTISPSVQIKEVASAPLLPVRLIDRERLCNLLALYRIGVQKRPTAHDKGTEFIVDDGYFTAIEARYPGVARALPGERQYVGIVVPVSSRTRGQSSAEK